ncbi:MAG: HlyD family efflux transporter periplasmic adaptor subunit [Methylococcales bacterium]|nr:HlyD family efflux transporter periplasmic adaptor subunit [Methylococcales bacterium]
MIVTKPVSLNVRPFRVSNLCFQVGGIIGESFAELGTTVSAFDFAHFYKVFRDANHAQAVDPGRLEFDSDGIDAQTKTTPIVGARPFALGALRAEAAKAGLNKAINARANAFITKYGNVAKIADFQRAIIPANAIQLALLSDRSEAMRRGLNIEYDNLGRTGVVTTTTTDVTSKHHEEPFVTTTTQVSDKITSSRAAHEDVVSAIAVRNNEKAGAVDIQKIENTGYEFRMPQLENNMRNDRLQASLGDERVAKFMQNLYLDRLEEVYKNELASLDADINQWQVAYLDTILLSPISGIVTGVYKNPGELVSPGEPVFRVEDNSEVLIVANVICRGPIAIGSMLQVKTPLFDSPDSRVTLEAPVVSARGQRDNDHWEVIAKCSNLDASGKTIFPLGYNFDYDTTEVNIFGAGEI